MHVVRVLMLTHRLPYAPNKGERIRAYHWLKAAAADHVVDLVSFADEDVSPADMSELRQIARSVHLVPLRRRSRYVCAAAAVLRGTSVTEQFFGGRRFAEALRQARASEGYDLTLVVCSNLGRHVLSGCAVGPYVADLVDVDSAKWMLHAQERAWPGAWMYARESRKLAILEKRLAEQAAGVVVISERDARLLRKIAPSVKVTVIPNGADVPRGWPAGCGPIDRLVFIGQMDYWPNVDAVLWFARHVWPALSKRRPSLLWFIVGRRPARPVRALGRLRNVVVTGQVADVRPYLTTSISVAPLRMACGVPNKVLEAMAAGRPVVASPAAVDGLRVRTQEELLVADEPAQWLAAIELLLADGALAVRIGAQARRAVERRFRWEQVEREMRACLEAAANAVRNSTERLARAGRLHGVAAGTT